MGSLTQLQVFEKLKQDKSIKSKIFFKSYFLLSKNFCFFTNT
nr:MAG TPA: hypothetical protein [Caudoviricetes sp.]